MNSTENPQNSQFGHLPDPSTQQGGLSSQNMDQRRPSNGGEDLQNQREGQNGQENRNTLQREEQPISDYDRPVFSEKNWFRFKALLVVGGMAANIAVRFALVSLNSLTFFDVFLIEKIYIWKSNKQPDDNVDCILDKTHGYLGFANSYLNNNTSFALYFKIFYNAVLDINIVTVMIHWVFFSQGWQYIFDLAVFFVVRFFCTHLIAYRDPEGIIWPESSIISISGTKQSDLQYQVSAFTGVAMINFLYWIQQSKKLTPILYKYSKLVFPRPQN